MRVSLVGASVAGVLPPTDATFASGRVSVVSAETEQAPTVLSLLAGGRMRPSSGTIDVEGAEAGLRASVALVDTPGVAEPPAELRLRTIVAEELMLAGAPSDRRAVRDFLHKHDADAFASTAMTSVPAAVRLTLLCELAVLRPGVEGVILTSPERHGGEARDWRAIVDGLATRGFAVLVVTSRAGAAALHSRPTTDLVTRYAPRRVRYLQKTRQEASRK